MELKKYSKKSYKKNYSQKKSYKKTPKTSFRQDPKDIKAEKACLLTPTFGSFLGYAEWEIALKSSASRRPIRPKVASLRLVYCHG
jgi:hypothetical protein